MTIDEAAYKYSTEIISDVEKRIDIQGFEFAAWVDGATSITAKEYWQQGMYTELEVLSLLTRWAPPEEISQLLVWFEENKKK